MRPHPLFPPYGIDRWRRVVNTRTGRVLRPDRRGRRKRYKLRWKGRSVWVPARWFVRECLAGGT